MESAKTTSTRSVMIQSTIAGADSRSPRTDLARAPEACSVGPMRLLATLLIACVGGCYQIDRPHFEVRDASALDGATSDALVPDAETGCVPDSIVCDDATDRYTECSSEGVVTRVMECPLGCSDSVEKCVDVDPSNGVAEYLDQAATDPNAPNLALGAGSTIDSDSGVVFDGAQSVPVPSVDVGSYRVLIVKSLTLTGSTKVSGTDGLIIVSDGDVIITDLLDLSADGQVNGPGGGPAPCDGSDGNVASGISGGAGGAASGDPGGNGGTSNNGGSPAGFGGTALTDVDLDPLPGGCEGGQGTLTASSCMSGFGGGGGSLQITSRTLVRVADNGVIDASGGGGLVARAGVGGCTSTSLRGGGGGGSGGALLVEAPQVQLEGAAVVLSTKGGGGSAGGVGNVVYDGADGGTDDQRALGGESAVTGIRGGQGGHETLPPTNGQSGGASQAGGGGGGAVGHTRFNTTAGTINPVGGAAVRSKYTTSMIRVRLVP